MRRSALPFRLKKAQARGKRESGRGSRGSSGSRGSRGSSSSSFPFGTRVPNGNDERSSATLLSMLACCPCPGPGAAQQQDGKRVWWELY